MPLEVDVHLRSDKLLNKEIKGKLPYMVEKKLLIVLKNFKLVSSKI